MKGFWFHKSHGGKVWVTPQQWRGHVNWVLHNEMRRLRIRMRLLNLAFYALAVTTGLFAAAFVFRFQPFNTAAIVVGMVWASLHIAAAIYGRNKPNGS